MVILSYCCCGKKNETYKLPAHENVKGETQCTGDSSAVTYEVTEPSDGATGAEQIARATTTKSGLIN